MGAGGGSFGPAAGAYDTPKSAMLAGACGAGGPRTPAVQGRTMRLRILGFVVGVCAFQLCPAWPALPSSGVAAAGLALGVGVAHFTRRRPVLGALALGVLWAAWHAQLGLAARLPPHFSGVALRVSGRVAGLPQDLGDARRFEFAVRSVRRGGSEGPRLRRITLVDYDGRVDLAAGAKCTLYVRLRPPRGASNPAGIDAERALFARRIDATGYLLAHPMNGCVSEPFVGAGARLRSRIAAAIGASVEDPGTAAVLRALAVGERAALSDRQWQVLQTTGTTHIVSISGLHVSMVAIALHFAVRLLFALWPALTRRVPAPAAGDYAGFAAALAYAALAGFEVPTRRSVLMLACLIWQRRRGHRLLHGDGVLVALGLVVFLDPLAVLTPSLWLSFGAIAALTLLAALLRGTRSGLRGLGVHLWLALLLAPLLAFLSPFVAWTSPLANFGVVPLVTWGVVPLTLIGLALVGWDPELAASCWRGAGALWGFGWRGLDWLADGAAQWRLPHAIPVACVPLVWLGLVLPLLPLGRARLALAPLLLASPWFAQPPQPALGGLRVTVYDVGQGLAVLVRTRAHALLYDAGPRGRGGRDAGRAIVVPNLRAAGVWTLDRLVISHADLDHAGGAAAVLSGLEVAAVSASPGDPSPPVGAEICTAGQRWVWDGVEFEFLHPPRSARGDDNQRSCVLSVADAAGRRVLLTGDIDAATEAALLRRPGALAAEVLITPHHGSRSSSSAPFVRAVGAREVIHSAAHGNRYGFPAPEVVARYARSGARQHVTGTHGAISVELPGTRAAARSVLRTVRWREARRRYWQAR